MGIVQAMQFIDGMHGEFSRVSELDKKGEAQSADANAFIKPQSMHGLNESFGLWNGPWCIEIKALPRKAPRRFDTNFLLWDVLPQPLLFFRIEYKKHSE